MFKSLTRLALVMAVVFASLVFGGASPAMAKACPHGSAKVGTHCAAGWKVTATITGTGGEFAGQLVFVNRNSVPVKIKLFNVDPAFPGSYLTFTVKSHHFQIIYWGDTDLLWKVYTPHGHTAFKKSVLRDTHRWIAGSDHCSNIPHRQAVMPKGMKHKAHTNRCVVKS